MEKDKKIDKKKKKSYKGVVIGLSVATGLLMATSVGLAVANNASMSRSMNYQNQLENVYQKNLYDLVESINNAEIKLSKVLSSNDKEFQSKQLTEVVKNAQLAENSISSLPITQNSLADSVKFINQMGGYSTTLVENLRSESQLSEKEIENLTKIHNSLVAIKEKLASYMDKIQTGYSIVSDSIMLGNENNSFTIKLSSMKEISVDYPSMIYDGPFSDSENDYIVKGLKGDIVTKSDAENSVVRCFKNIAEIEYAGEINSNFQTYNFNLSTTDEHNLFVQVSKIGGHVLTVSGYNNQNEKNISMDEGKKIALDFVKQNGIENAECVWSDILSSEAYFNIAPKQNGIILYPDLVKVKIDLATGTVIGYDASSYFINHIDRNLSGDFEKASEAKKHLPQGFESGEGRLVLAPLDYSREVVCYEFESEKNGETYYFYINAVSNKLENVLKVIKTTDGAKLM